MRRILCFVFVAGCSGADFNVGAVGLGSDAGDDAEEVDTGTGETPDAGPTDSRADSGTPDTGKPPSDSAPDTGIDTGTPDTGTPPVDSGSPDTGTPPVDSGTPDTGTPPPDAPTSWTGVFPATADTATFSDGPRMWAGGDAYQGTRETGMAWVSTVKGEIRLTTAGACGPLDVILSIKGTSGDWVNSLPVTVKIPAGTYVIPYTWTLPAPIQGPSVQFAYVNKNNVGSAACGVLWTMNTSPLTFK